MPQLQAIRQKTSAVSNNYEAGGVAIVCTKPVKKSCVPNERTSRKGVRSDRANSSPACCRERCENPPEYTVFECRIDGNRPIAQVVHVQSDTTDSALENKTCMLLETKQSEYGPTSRLIFIDREPDSKNQKQEHNSHPEKEHGAVSSSKNNKKVVDEKEKLEKIIRDSPDGKKAKIKLRAVKSRELLAGVVYYDCDCYHRNGLQQDCPRGECRGTKRCLAKPWPDCDMARYFRWKWGRYYRLLDLIPPTTFCGPRDVLFQAKVGRENVPKVEKKCEKLGKPSGVETNAKSGEKKAVPPKERHQRKCRDLENYHTCQKYALIPVVVDDSHDR